MASIVPKVKKTKNASKNTTEKSKDNEAGSQSSTKKAEGEKTPSNTPSWIYVSTKNLKSKCKNDKDAIEKCDPKSEPNPEHIVDKEKLKKSKNNLGVFEKLTKSKNSNSRPEWMNTNCNFLEFKPSRFSKNLDKEFKNQKNELLQKVDVEKALTNEVTKVIEKKATEIIAKKAAGKVLMKTATLLTGPFAIVLNVGMLIYDGYDAKKTYDEIASQAKEQFKKIDELRKEISEIKQKLADFEKIWADKNNRQSLLSDAMYAKAESNGCLRARRCMLVPYEETTYFNDTSSKKAPADAVNESEGGDEEEKIGKGQHVKTKGSGPHTGKGCCPGQTGHHVMPQSMFKNCPDYNKFAAPTICVEGSTQYHGSHGMAHANLAKTMRTHEKTNGAPIKNTLKDRETAYEIAASAVKLLFPYCDKDCIIGQLKAYHKKLNCEWEYNSGLPDGKSVGAGQI